MSTSNTQNTTEMRTHMCGEPNAADVGSTITVCGWVARRREHGEHLAFVDLRDHTGLLQCVVDGSLHVRSEYVLSVTGVLAARPEGTVNEKLPTGEVELTECTVEVLSVAEPPPFPLDERAAEVDENIRLRHRYLDMRRPEMQQNLRRRAAMSSAVRSAMDSQGFVEVETPMLIASTPEGARLRGAQPAAPRELLRAATEPPSSSSSCAWSAGSTATTRWRAACVTRTCAPTASSSSPNSTSR
ncbi:MAG: OB-fold nucleic acid binding domain-containing protein [Microthrixaceae bacterium]|nr:OB-fold nucleic acid binding domain-containing protein [Microthrixaceae bacterium]